MTTTREEWRVTWRCVGEGYCAGHFYDRVDAVQARDEADWRRRGNLYANVRLQRRTVSEWEDVE